VEEGSNGAAQADEFLLPPIPVGPLGGVEKADPPAGFHLLFRETAFSARKDHPHLRQGLQAAEPDHWKGEDLSASKPEEKSPPPGPPQGKAGKDPSRGKDGPKRTRTGGKEPGAPKTGLGGSRREEKEQENPQGSPALLWD